MRGTVWMPDILIFIFRHILENYAFLTDNNGPGSDFFGPGLLLVRLLRKLKGVAICLKIVRAFFLKMR